MNGPAHASDSGGSVPVAGSEASEPVPSATNSTTLIGQASHATGSMRLPARTPASASARSTISTHITSRLFARARSFRNHIWYAMVAAANTMIHGRNRFMKRTLLSGFSR